VLGHRAFDDTLETGGFQIGFQQQVMRPCHGDQPGRDGAFRLDQAGGGAHALAHDGGHHGQHVLHAVVNFVGEDDLDALRHGLGFGVQPRLLQHLGEISVLDGQRRHQRPSMDRRSRAIEAWCMRT